MYDDEGNELKIVLPEGTVISTWTNSYSYSTEESDGNKTQHSGTYDGYKVRGDENAMALFKFIAHNVSAKSMVEFSLTQTGIAGDKGLNFITTGHVRGKEPGMSTLFNTQLVNGYHLRNMFHIHPVSNHASEKDIKMKNDIIEAMLTNKTAIPTFGIYHVPSKSFINF